MTNLALRNKDDYPSAAKKHLNDAQALIAAKRFDGAGYLTGYVVECSLRTVVLVGAFARLGRVLPGQLADELRRSPKDNLKRPADAARDAGRDHDLAALAKAAVEYSADLRLQSAAYAPTIDTKKPPFGAWTHALRYRAEAGVPEAEARAWLAEAEALYVTTIGARERNRWILR